MLSLNACLLYLFVGCGCGVVDALNHIAKTIGATDWNFDANACGVMKIPVIETDPTTNITCNTVNSTSHIIAT